MNSSLLMMALYAQLWKRQTGGFLDQRVTPGTQNNVVFRRLKVGRDHFISREYEMTLDEVKQFAGQYDPQPFHLDEEAAAQHPIFQGLASGWHTSAVTMRLWTECFPVAGGPLGTESSLRWPSAQPVLAIKFMLKLKLRQLQPSKTKIRSWYRQLCHAGFEPAWRCAININNQNYGFQKTNLIFE